MSQVIEETLKKQVELGLSDTEFAEHLGISPTMWWYLRTGQRELGKKSYQAIANAFPELIGYINGERIIAINTEHYERHSGGWIRRLFYNVVDTIRVYFKVVRDG